MAKTLICKARDWLGVLLMLSICLLANPASWAAPVDWQEVTPTADGRQWWDAGSLRRNRKGNLSVLSRYQPAAEQSDEGKEFQRPGSLYVMELDCGQDLYRDVSVNGIPRFRAQWQAAADDSLITAVIQESCETAASLFPVE